jgi:hypothetical protein
MASDTNLPHRDSETLLPQSDPFVQAMDIGNRPVINPVRGGQYGWAGNVFDYVSTQPHVSQQAWCIVLSTPAGFSRLPAGDQLHSLCKSFLENRTRIFEGLSDQTVINFADMRWTGHRMAIAVGAQRTLGAVTHTGYDVEGEPFTKMFKVWQQWLVMDAEILNAKMVILDDPGDMMLDETGYSAIYFEPTRNFRDIAHAAILVGGQPTQNVKIDLKRNKDEDNVIRDIAMEFTGVIEFDTYAVIEIARQMLKLMPLHNPDATTAPIGFTQRTAIVENSQAGNIERMVEQAVRVDNPSYLG